MKTQYRIIAAAAGYADRSDRGRIRLTGPDSRSFLQALVSNDLTVLPVGSGVYATYLTPQGRMIADLEVYARDGALLCAVAPGMAAALTDRLDQSIFSEDTRVEDVSAELAEVAVIGARAPAVLAEVLPVHGDRLESLSELGQADFEDGFVARSGESALPSFHVFLPAPRRSSLIESLEHAGLSPISDDLLEAMRIERGRGAWGRELTTDTIPLEAGLLDRAISTSKGCYVGQEIIIRILHRGGGRVAKRLVRLAGEDGPAATRPVPGAALTSADGADAGRVTSVSPALDTDGWIALAYVGRDYAEVGTRLQLRESGMVATIAGLAA
jgi:folate-binding protein YgfZ